MIVGEPIARRWGTESTHCRTGTKCAARSAMRRPPHEGQKPLPLHENGSNRSNAQSPHRIRAKPFASTPQWRNFRNSRMTNDGNPTPSVRSRTVAAKSVQCPRTMP
jgi:hypothetical protein